MPGKTGTGVGLGVAMIIIFGLLVMRPFELVGAWVAMTSPGGLYVIPAMSHLTCEQHCPGIDSFLQ